MARTNPEYMSEPHPPEFPVIPGDHNNNAGGIIIQGNKCAVRTECAKNSTLCPQKGGPICWDQIMVTDDHG